MAEHQIARRAGPPDDIETWMAQRKADGDAKRRQRRTKLSPMPRELVNSCSPPDRATFWPWAPISLSDAGRSLAPLLQPNRFRAARSCATLRQAPETSDLPRQEQSLTWSVINFLPVHGAPGRLHLRIG